MKRYTLYLPKAQIEALAKRSLATGAPVAELIRRAIGNYLNTKPITPESLLRHK